MLVWGPRSGWFGLGCWFERGWDQGSETPRKTFLPRRQTRVFGVIMSYQQLDYRT